MRTRSRSVSFAHSLAAEVSSVRLPDSKPLSREDERKHIILAKRGIRTSRDLLIKSNQRYVLKCAYPFWKRFGGDLEDYMQEGNVGLVKAIEKFELAREFKLITYATHWIKAYISNFALKTINMVHWATTSSLRTMYYQYPRAVKALNEKQIEVTDESVAAYLGAKVSEVETFRLMSGGNVSLDAPIDGEDGNSFIELIAGTAPAVDDEMESGQETLLRRTKVRKALAHLDERERWIVENRLMSEFEDKATLSDVGVRFGFSRERARQLELRAIDKLTRLLALEDIKPPLRPRPPPTPTYTELPAEKPEQVRQVRKRTRLRPQPQPTAPAEVPVNAIKIVGGEQEFTLVGRVWVDLSPTQKEAWLLKRNGWPKESIAAIMGITPSTVNDLLRIAEWKILHPPQDINHHKPEST